MTDNKGKLGRATEALRRLSPERLELASALIEQLARDQGVDVGRTAEHLPPVTYVDRWVTKLKSERRSERTIKMYEYLARRFLAQVPDPTRFGK